MLSTYNVQVHIALSLLHICAHTRIESNISLGGPRVSKLSSGWRSTKRSSSLVAVLIKVSQKPHRGSSQSRSLLV